MRRSLLAIAFAFAVAHPATAQSIDSTLHQPAQPVASLGQPGDWLPYAAGLLVSGRDAPIGAGGLLGVYRPVLNPVTGLLGVAAEGVGEWRSGGSAASLRLVASVPVLGTGFGADWRVTHGDVAALVTFHTALRRGGLAGDGSMVRVDWLPASHVVDVGVQLPLHQPFAGRTRPTRTSADVPNGPRSTSVARGEAERLPASVERALGAMSDAASLLRVYAEAVSPSDRAMLVAAEHSRLGTTYTMVARTYAASIATAFSGVLRDSARGDVLSARARAQLLDGVVLPYDALLGQVKDAGALASMVGATHERFATWLRDSSGFADADRPPVLRVFDRWLGIVTDQARTLLDQWKDSRFVWLPIQLALAPNQYEVQEEIDALIGRAVGHSFTSGNDLAYLRTADLPLEIARSIAATRRYHVLWTHDFTGRRPSGRLDEISYTIVADAYLPALTEAVRRYDSTGVFPHYLILLDAFYYHARDGRLWMDVLEDPLNAPIRLRDDETRQADHLRERLAALRAAVARSSRLQREAASHGGASWLASVVAVHVNIMLPSDFSFRSSHTLPPFPFTPDNIIRDHRKLVLFDVTEADPFAGDVLVTGIGIGEHYASATWEDRGYRIRGPAALEARAAVRQALTSNGLRPDQIPEPLRASESVRVGADHGGDDGSVGRALQVHNEPGFGSKKLSVARAMLYTLAPPGSVIIAPDPLWVSDTWAAMLAGAAARGCRVIIIAPSLANGPNPETAVVALERNALRQFLSTRDQLASRMRAVGGELRIGIYAAHAPVTDVAGRLGEVRAGLTRSPWIRELIPFDESALAALDRATSQATGTDTHAILARDETPREPQLHQKTMLIARPGAIAALVRQPGWTNVLARTLRAQSQETAELAAALAAPRPAADTAAARATSEMLAAYERSLGDADRKRLSFYFVVGSQNHDSRGLALDGEASVVVSGFDASVGLVDLFYLMARTTWIEKDAEIDRLVPPPRGLLARLARLIRLTI